MHVPNGVSGGRWLVGNAATWIVASEAPKLVGISVVVKMNRCASKWEVFCEWLILWRFVWLHFSDRGWWLSRAYDKWRRNVIKAWNPLGHKWFNFLPGLLQMTYPIMSPPLIMQFMAAFHNDKVIFYYAFIFRFFPSILPYNIWPISFPNFLLQTFIQIPSFYHRQWTPSMHWVMSIVQMCWLDVCRGLAHVCWSSAGLKCRSKMQLWSQAKKLITVDS